MMDFVDKLRKDFDESLQVDDSEVRKEWESKYNQAITERDKLSGSVMSPEGSTGNDFLAQEQVHRRRNRKLKNRKSQKPLMKFSVLRNKERK